MEENKLTVKDFIFKVLNGSALGVVLALIANAVLGAILSYVKDVALITTIIQVGIMIQMTVSFMIGALVAFQFGFDAKKAMIVGAAAFAASGVVKFNPEAGKYLAAGTGDIINIMLTSAIAVLMLMAIKDKFGSVSIILLPIVVGVGAGTIGVLMYPYVTQITVGIGMFINNLTNLQPLVMSILIGICFAILIASPISTVAIGLAIQLNGLSSGAAAMGVAATTVLLVVNSLDVNEKGVTIAAGLGGMKMFMPNLFKYPVITAPIIFSALISAIPVALFNIQGTPASSGFGLVGLVSPLASLDDGLGFVPLIIAWLIVPIAAAILGKFVFEKILKLYDHKEVFKFQG